MQITLPFIADLYTDKKLDFDGNKTVNKSLPNILVGKLGKKWNNKEQAFSYKTEEEAHREHKKLGGTLHSSGENAVFYHSIKLKKLLKNGFLPIHHMIYDDARAKLYKMSIELEQIGVNILAYKTDAIYFVKPNDIGLANIQKLVSPEIGGWKLETEKLPTNNKIELKDNMRDELVTLRQNHDRVAKQIFINDEFDRNEIYSKLIPSTLGIGAGGVGW